MKTALKAMMGYPQRQVDDNQIQEACRAVKVNLNVKAMLITAGMPDVPEDMAEKDHVFR